MQFIDKAGERAPGNEIVDRILSESWSGEIYIGADYETLCKPEFRQNFLEVLLAEQNSLCCYCVRSILTCDTSIEHIIPQKLDGVAFNRYIGLSDYFNSVIYKDDFDRKKFVIPPAKYPHDISYYNLVGSCKSNTHCNHYRGNAFIRPLFYDELIYDKVLYDKSGLAFSEEYLDELSILGLSIDRKLIVYRAIWCRLAEKYSLLDEFSEDDLKETILMMSLEGETNEILNNFFNEPLTVKVFFSYKWFFQYYRKPAA